MFRLLKAVPFSLIVPTLLILSAACRETSDQPTAPLQAARSTTAPPHGDYVITPAGYYHRSCVHEIPNGAHVNKSGLVRRRDGITYTIPKCMYAPTPNVPGPWRGRHGNDPTNNGWVEYAWDTLPAGNHYAQLITGWRVPAAPTGTYSDPQVFFSFPGLENSSYIIQPVIQYGFSSAGGGRFWTAASWRCNSGSDCLHGPLINVGATDSVYGSVTASACVNGTCTWTIVTVDVTTGARSDWTADDTDDYFWTTGGAVEVYNLTTCNQYGGNGVFYKGISLEDRYGSNVVPAWNKAVQGNLDPACGFDVGFTSSTVNLVYNPPAPLSAFISGPTQVRPTDQCTWYSNVSGGLQPYSYAWSGVLSGNGPQVTGRLSESGLLNLDVTSADGQHSHDDIFITVSSQGTADGPDVLCPP